MPILYETTGAVIDNDFVRFGEKTIPIQAITSVETGDNDEYRSKGGCMAITAGIFGIIAISNIAYSFTNVLVVGFVALICAAVSASMYAQTDQSTKTVTVRTGGLLTGHVYSSRSGDDVRAVKEAIEQAMLGTQGNGAEIQPDSRQMAGSVLGTARQSSVEEGSQSVPPSPSATTENAGTAVSSPDTATPQVARGCWVAIGLAFVAIVLLVIVVPSPDKDRATTPSAESSVATDETDTPATDSFVVTQVATGDEWPYLSAKRGIIRCEPGTHQVTIELNERKFGLNGKAQGQGGFEPSQSLSGVDQYGIIKVPPSKWIERGLALCDY